MGRARTQGHNQRVHPLDECVGLLRRRQDVDVHREGGGVVVGRPGGGDRQRLHAGAEEDGAGRRSVGQRAGRRAARHPVTVALSCVALRAVPNPTSAGLLHWIDWLALFTVSWIDWLALFTVSVPVPLLLR